MSSDKVTDVGLTDFQILETDSFDQGLEFHINLQCPACESFKNNFVCCHCVQSELLTNSKLSPSGILANNDRITSIRNQMLDVKNKIKRYQPALFKSESSVINRVMELKSLMSSLRSTVNYLTELNKTKRRRQCRLRQAMSRYHAASQQLLERQLNLMRHFSALSQRRKLLLFNLNSVNDHMKQMHDKLLEELLCTHFVIEISSNSLTPDKFASSPLHIDRERIFTGPEPTPSSHTALTYCSNAIRVATILLDVWLPPFIRRNLHLTGAFLSVLPQRDDLGRVYSAIIHAVHLLCMNRGIDVSSGLARLGITLPPSGRSVYNPLLGLYCLGHLVNGHNQSIRFFDEPYELKLNGFFGHVPIPTRLPYRLIPVDQGVEADATSVQQTTECYPTESTHRLITDCLTTSSSGPYHVLTCSNTIITATSLKSIYRTNTTNTVDESDCWELVSLNSVGPVKNNFTLNAVDPVDTSTLSTVWRLAKGFMNSPTPPDTDTGYGS